MRRTVSALQRALRSLRRPAPSRTGRRRTRPLALEQLENRLAPAVITASVLTQSDPPDQHIVKAVSQNNGDGPGNSAHAPGHLKNDDDSGPPGKSLGHDKQQGDTIIIVAMLDPVVNTANVHSSKGTGNEESISPSALGLGIDALDSTEPGAGTSTEAQSSFLSGGETLTSPGVLALDPGPGGAGQHGAAGQTASGQGDLRGDSSIQGALGLAANRFASGNQNGQHQLSKEDEDPLGDGLVGLDTKDGQLLAELPQARLVVEATTTPGAELVVMPAVVKGPLTEQAPAPSDQANDNSAEAGMAEVQQPDVGAALRGLLDQLLQNLTVPPLDGSSDAAGEQPEAVLPAGDGAQDLGDAATANHDHGGWGGFSLALLPLLLNANLDGCKEERKRSEVFLAE
jgi:hypothetical protein